MKRLTLIFFILLAILAACNREDLPPKVYLPSPVAASVTTDDTLFIEFTATDDQQLASVGFVVSPAFDSIPGTLNSWRISEYATIGVNTFFFKDSIEIPDSINAGSYLVQVFATDASSFTDTLSNEFAISSKVDSILPQLDTIIAPDTLMEGQDLSLNFDLSDDTRLAYAKYTLISRINDSLLLENDTVLMGTDYAGSVVLQNIGDYQRVRFEMECFDWVHNKIRKTTDIIIKEN